MFLETEEAQGFRVTAAMIEHLISPRTKLIILNSPSNPSGAVMSPEDQTEVVRLAAQRGIWVLSDECYVYLNYSGRQFSVGSLHESSARAHRDRGLSLEDLCHDGMAAYGICAGAGGYQQRHGEARRANPRRTQPRSSRRPRWLR